MNIYHWPIHTRGETRKEEEGNKKWMEEEVKKKTRREMTRGRRTRGWCDEA